MNLNQEQISIALFNMNKYGGGFVQSLTVCYRKADPHNKEILVKSFNKIFIKYANFSNEP
tara:strand:- start:242 stop:421 length:180 start_codon:yes stop_codon:yes gene_type:complete